MNTDQQLSPGLQLWSVQKLLDEDPARTLEKIAAMGIQHVELSAPSPVDDIAPLLPSLGLTAKSLHFFYSYLSDDWEVLNAYHLPIPPKRNFQDLIESAVKYGIDHLVLVVLFPEERGNADHYKGVAEKLYAAGELCRQAGIQLSYHHHHFEFKPVQGIKPFTIFQEYTSEESLKFEIDVFWLKIMGIDPVSFIDKLSHRISLLHLKDLRKDYNEADQVKPLADLTGEVEILGQGQLDFASILQAALKNEVAYLYMELEGPKLADNLPAIQNSFQYLNSLKHL